MERSRVYELIDGERDYQKRVWPRGEARTFTVGNEVLLLEEYLTRARSTWSREVLPEQMTLAVVRKIAAIAVRCLEHHDADPR